MFFNIKNLSDKSVQVALDEYKSAVAEDLGEWYAMKIALEIAIAEEEKRFHKPTPVQQENNFIFLAVLIAIASFVIGMVVKWVA